VAHRQPFCGRGLPAVVRSLIRLATRTLRLSPLRSLASSLGSPGRPNSARASPASRPTSDMIYMPNRRTPSAPPARAVIRQRWKRSGWRLAASCVCGEARQIPSR
jgi:hypothetical protein